MQLFIDKENIVSLMKSPEYLMEICTMLRKGIRVHYNFSRAEVASNPVLMNWFRFVDGGRLGKVEPNEFVPEFGVTPERPVSGNFYKNVPTKGAPIFLINEEHMCDVIAEKGCVLIGKVGEEIKIFSQLLALEDCEKISNTIKDWRDYCPRLPLTDIILLDNHYFKDKWIYDKDANQLLNALSSIPQQSPVSVVIITKAGEIDPRLDLTKEAAALKSKIKQWSGSSKSTLTILTTRKAHDRNVITNYYRLKNGSCFHLENGLKDDVSTDIKSHAKPSNVEVTKGILDLVKSVIKSPVAIYGDKIDAECIDNIKY